MSEVAAVARDHFAHIAPDWSQLGPPLRPSPGDSAALQQVVNTLQPDARVVVLGLTPEIVGCDWPPGTRLCAVDHSPAMLAALWPPRNGPAQACALRGDWCALPLAASSVDLVAGDGCYVLLDHPQGYAALTREVRRVLRPGGRYAMRVFLRPDRAESVAEVAQALADGAIGSVHALKLRLLAALHGASGAGSRLDDVWQAWSVLAPRLPAHLAGTRGWTAPEIVGIAAYRGLQARYYLPTLDELRQALRPWFAEAACVQGCYELAERCPTLICTAS